MRVKTVDNDNILAWNTRPCSNCRSLQLVWWDGCQKTSLDYAIALRCMTCYYELSLPAELLQKRPRSPTECLRYWNVCQRIALCIKESKALNIT